MQQKTGLEWTTPSELAEQLEELYGLKCPPMWGPPRRLYYRTFGPHVARVMTALGLPPMPWQRYVADVATEVDPDTGVLAYREVDLSIMRQQGKTALVLGKVVHRLRAWHRARVLYTAQTRNDARDKLLEDFWPTIQESTLGRQFKERKGLGQEAITCLTTRSRLSITSTREEAGHGNPLDDGVIDEAFSHEDERLEQAMSPAMLTKPMAQLWVVSAAGTEKSKYWNGKRAQGRELIERLWRSGLTQWPSTFYAEWFAPDWMPRDDPATWWFCMPALGHTITEATVKAELEKLGADEFDRGMLNRTKKSRPPVDLNVPTADEWKRLEDGLSQPGRDIALAWEVSPDRSSGAIGMYGPRADGRGHTEVIDHRPGVAWMVPRLVELRRRWDPIAIGVDDRGPGAALLAELKKHGIDKPKDPKKPQRGDLVVTNAQDMAQACGQWADAVREDRMRHIGQDEMAAALAAARTRPLGDTWAWGRRRAEADIGDLVTSTLARYAYELRAPIVGRAYDPLDYIH